MKITRLLAALLPLFAGVASAQSVVISQVYGAGGNSGATLTNDFVEVFNRGSVAVSLDGWSVQYASATGTGNFSGAVALTGSLAPGAYRLVRLGGGANGAALPAQDFEGGILAAAGAGKFALVRSSTNLACNGGSAPCSPEQRALIVDLVGYGNANFFEGSAAAPTLSATTAALRGAGGCSDTDNNGADFATGAPSPRNAATAANVCGGEPVSAPIVTNCPALTLAAGVGGNGPLGASDVDGIVNSLVAVGTLPAGLSLGALTPALGAGGSAGSSIVVAPGTAAGSYAATLRWGNNQGQTSDCTVLVNVASVTRIPVIQGSGATSLLVGQVVLTEGVVTRTTNLGYFLQDALGDGNAATSDGLFVFNGAAAKPLPGQLVRLTGTVTEFNAGAATNPATAANPLTQLTSASPFTVLQSGLAVAPVVVDLLDPAVNLERVEGMLVKLQGPITVSQNFFLGRFGQMTVSAGGRLENPTNVFRPGAEAQARAAQNARRSVLLDDATSLQNPNPIPYIGADNTVRAGDTVESLTGVIDFGLATASNTGIASYRLQPTVTPSFTRSNPRTLAPAAVGGNLKVASFNVLNFFTTFLNGETADGLSGQGCSLGASVAAGNCRGANNLQEFERQRAKIVEAMAAIDADVLGLIEIQNNGLVAAQNLVDALNARVGAGSYKVVPDPATGTGTDAIKLALIYKPARVSPVGEALSDTDDIHNRPPLAQTFAAPNGERFSVVVNHFKSKGCDGAVGLDLDQGDLQGCFNDQRTKQSEALRAFVEGVQAMADSDDVLVIGDLNAYAKEDPIDLLTSAETGWVDEIGRYNTFGYSFTFDGAAGRLDHALTTPTLSAKVTGATEWHINTDEPSVIDYNLEFKPQDLYSASAYRSSDHDPVVVGLNLVKTVQGTRKRDVLVGSVGDDLIIGGRGPDLLVGNGGADVFRFLQARGGVDIVTDFLPGNDRLDLRALLGSGGADPIASGAVRVLRIGHSTLLQLRSIKGPKKRKDFRTLVILRGVLPSQIVASRDLLY